jgi:hypothetical protein
MCLERRPQTCVLDGVPLCCTEIAWGLLADGKSIVKVGLI